MNRYFTRWFCICSIPLSFAGICSAQNKPTQNILLSPPAGITIDGNLKEWGDSLRYFNADKQIHYSLANDKENLYVAVRVNDYTDQVRILNAGLTLGIDTRGKKKESFALTFPVGEQAGPTLYGIPKHANADLTQEDRDDLTDAKITKLRGIKVTGFSDIEGDFITTSNTYGIKTAIDYDKDGNLVCEAAIPLKFFHADDPTKNEWAFNIKINGIASPSPNKGGGDQEGPGGAGRGGGGGFGGGGRGGRGGGGGGRGNRGGGANPSQADHNEFSKTVDFWEKYYLAK